jgi:AraC-like DNA-binding protein
MYKTGGSMNKTVVKPDPANPRVMDNPVVVGCCAAGTWVVAEDPGEQWHMQPVDVVSIARHGSYTLHWEYDRQVRVDEGCAAIIPRGIRRRSHLHGVDGQMSICYFHLDILSASDGMSVLVPFDTPAVLSGSIVDELLDVHRRLAEVLGNGTELQYGEILAKALGLQALAMVFPYLQNRASRHHACQRVAPLLRRLDSESADDMSVADMARCCCLSPSRFHRVFSLATGLTPKAYQRRRRLERAAHLLRETELSLAQVADRTGFSDQFHLSRRFSREFGVPPSAYRRTTSVDFV